MNFSVGDFSVGGPLIWVLGPMIVLTPLLYLAVAWRPARRGSRRGIWLAAAVYLGACVLLTVAARLAVSDPVLPGTTLAFPLVLLGPAVLACAVVLHFAARPGGPSPGVGSLLLAALLGYLAMPAGLILAMVIVSTTLSGH